MSLYKNRKEESPVTSIPPHPNHCSVMGCENDTTVAIMMVRTQKGTVIKGSFGEFAYTKRMGDTNVALMRDRYSFVGWITRCADCYLKDLVKHNRNAGAYPAGYL